MCENIALVLPLVPPQFQPPGCSTAAATRPAVVGRRWAHIVPSAASRRMPVSGLMRACALARGHSPSAEALPLQPPTAPAAPPSPGSLRTPALALGTLVFAGTYQLQHRGHSQTMFECATMHAQARIPIPRIYIGHTTTVSATTTIVSDFSLPISRLFSVLFPATSCVYTTLVANRVFYKVQIAGAMADYTFFICLFTAACYVLIYFPVLLLRILTRKVARSQIRAAVSSHLPLFAAIGTLEALTLTLQMHAATRIPGSLLAILGQT
jgi:hypothetical protein